jgi:hypothetical protein
VGVAGGVTMRLIGMFAMLLLLAYDAGLYNARDKVSFFVCGSDRSRVLLRIYGDTAISSHFDPEQHTLTGYMFLQKISDSPLIIRNKDVGPLRRSKAP